MVTPRFAALKRIVLACIGAVNVDNEYTFEPAEQQHVRPSIEEVFREQKEQNCVFGNIANFNG